MKNEINIQRGCSHQLINKKQCCNHSCSKLSVYNQFKNYPSNINTPDIVEVRFKNTRKAFYKNSNKLMLTEGDMIAVEASPGHDIGIVSLTGEHVLEQMKIKGVPINEELKIVYRKVKAIDIMKWEDAISRENIVMLKTRKIAKEFNLNMKIGDVEFQGDGTKAIFYYIADERVDFRGLIKELASKFRIRIKMKQIGARQEAGRIGGIGSCGRELCCASWMTSFISVTTDTAREQELSLNPQKLAGQCGKLKCCLNFEVKSYKDAKKDFPPKIELITQEGKAYYMKSDIYRKLMWYSFSKHEYSKVTVISVERVKKIIILNEKGVTPKLLKLEIDKNLLKQPDYKSVIGEDSITRFDKKKKRRKRYRKPYNKKSSYKQKRK